jgi:hypothetical protein
MVDFNKKLKVDRIKLFVDVVTKMANGTPAEGYAIGEAIKALPENLQQYLISEVPDRIIRREHTRREHTRRELNRMNADDFIDTEAMTETYKEEVFKADKVKALKGLLGIKGEFTDEMDVVEEILKCFPSRLTLNEFCNNVYMKEIGL